VHKGEGSPSQQIRMWQGSLTRHRTNEDCSKIGALQNVTNRGEDDRFRRGVVGEVRERANNLYMPPHCQLLR